MPISASTRFGIWTLLKLHGRIAAIRKLEQQMNLGIVTTLSRCPASVVLCLSLVAAMAHGEPQAKSPSPEMDADALADWQKPGARLKWIGPNEFGAVSDSVRKDELEDPIPGFVFGRPMGTELSKLASPKTPFGISATLSGALSPAQIRQLKAFPNLKYLGFNSSGRAKEYGGLGDLQQLEALEVGWEDGDDAFFKSEVLRLKKLRHLGLTFGKYTEKTYEMLATMKTLESLHVSHIPFPDAGLQRLTALPNLKTLSLTSIDVDPKAARFGPKGVATIGKLTKLEHLGLYATGLKDDDLTVIAGMSELKSLKISKETLSDAAFAKLAALKNLEKLDILSSKISKAAVEELKKAKPDLKITGPK